MLQYELRMEIIKAIENYLLEEAAVRENVAEVILKEAENLETYGNRGRDEVYKSDKLIVKIRGGYGEKKRCREVVFYDTKIHIY